MGSMNLAARLILSLPLFTACGAPGSTTEMQDSRQDNAIQLQYLEYVTSDVDATCAALAQQQGVTFGEPAAELGGARTAPLDGGGWLGVRGPLRPDEAPVVRPYRLVDDLDAAVEAARAAGGEIALPPTEIPGRGTFAIYVHVGIEHGLWQR